MKRYILQEANNFSSRIFAIVSNKPFVELTWHIKQNLDIPFVRDEDVHALIGERTNFFPRFSYHDPERETDYTLIRNRGINGLLAPELKNVDVFLVETNYSLTFDIKSNQISKTTFVDFCFDIKQDMLKPESIYLLNS